MSRRISACGSLLLALALAFPASARANASAPDQPPAGYHDVKMTVGNKPVTIRVADQQKPHLNGGGSSNGQYDPQSMDFSRTSSFANKTFSTRDATLTKNDTAEEAHDQKRFITSAFSTSAYNQSDHTFETAAYKDSSRPNADFSKTFQLPDAASDANKTFAVKGSDDQDKKALIADNPKNKMDPFATPWTEGDKRFYDPTMLRVPHHRHSFHLGPGADSDHLSDLPNRPLTIDEVRKLINDEQIPDLDSPPEAASKPLNDPAWAPEVKPPMIDDKAAPATPPPDEAKDGELPAPGEMAKPDTNGPLPK